MYSITSKLIIKIHKRFTIEKINNNLKFFIKKLNLKRKINNKFVGLSKIDMSKNFTQDLERFLTDNQIQVFGFKPKDLYDFLTMQYES